MEELEEDKSVNNVQVSQEQPENVESPYNSGKLEKLGRFLKKVMSHHLDEYN